MYSYINTVSMHLFKKLVCMHLPRCWIVCVCVRTVITAASASLDFRHLANLNVKPLWERRRNSKPSQGYGRLLGCHQFVRISAYLCICEKINRAMSLMNFECYISGQFQTLLPMPFYPLYTGAVYYSSP